MRVLFWQELFWPYIGGIEVLATKLLLALRQRGHEIVVVTRQDDPVLPSEGQYQGIPIYRYPFATTFTNKTVDQFVAIRSEIIRLKRSFAPDLVHLNSFGMSVLFYLATADIQPAPLLLTLHTPPRSGLFGRIDDRDGLFNKTIRSAQWITCVSHAVYAIALEVSPDIPDKSSVIYNGVNLAGVSPRPLLFDPPRVIYLGRLVRDKGVDLLLSSFATVLNHSPRAQLTIAGDGPQRVELETRCGELGLTHSVEFLGAVAPDQIPALLNTATVVAMPSRREGLPSVAIEAALMARPLVATTVGGLPEIVIHGETGLLVPPDDVRALADNILFLFDHPEIATAFGEAACRRANKVFNFGSYADAYDDLYRRICRESAHGFA